MTFVDDMDEIKQELIDIVTESLNTGLKYGVITKEQYIESMREVNDMKNDSPEEIRALVNLLIEDHEQSAFENGDKP